VAITLVAYGVAYEQRCVSGFGNRDEVAAATIRSAASPRWCLATARR
jgi:hypothetical protein